MQNFNMEIIKYVAFYLDYGEGDIFFGRLNGTKDTGMA